MEGYLLSYMLRSLCSRQFEKPFALAQITWRCPDHSSMEDVTELRRKTYQAMVCMVFGYGY
jgi:hypothetical protein